MDQATITGESTPVEKGLDALVYNGHDQSSPARWKSLANWLDGEIPAFAKSSKPWSAESRRAPVQKMADQYAGYLVHFALTCAALTLAITRDARTTISMIIIAGACGIAAGTPLAVLGAIGRAARVGAR